MVGSQKLEKEIGVTLGLEKAKTKRKRFSNVDGTDIKIIGLLTAGYDNRQISSELQIPLSTIQRRTRLILQAGLVQHFYKPNYRGLGLKKGMIHVYLEDGNMRPTAEKIAQLDGITSVSIHIGNSDIIGDFVYKDSDHIVDLIASIKKLEGVERTVWSEEVSVLPVNKQNVESQYRRLLEEI